MCKMVAFSFVKICKTLHGLRNTVLTRQLTMRAEMVRFIEENTEITRESMTPEIRLHLITKNCRLWHAKADECPVQDPFWAFYWPGGQALTRYILDNPSVVKGKSVFDVGSGCGSSAIASVLCGATRVVANDICPVSCTAVEMNASLNNVRLETNETNNIGRVSDLSCDILLVGDLFYDAEMSEKIFSWIKEVHRSGRDILIGDPGRLSFKEHRAFSSLKTVAVYELDEKSRKENNGFMQSSVWAFKR